MRPCTPALRSQWERGWLTPAAGRPHRRASPPLRCRRQALRNISIDRNPPLPATIWRVGCTSNLLYCPTRDKRVLSRTRSSEPANMPVGKLCCCAQRASGLRYIRPASPLSTHFFSKRVKFSSCVLCFRCLLFIFFSPLLFYLFSTSGPVP
jgi:hypothetical protein